MKIRFFENGSFDLCAETLAIRGAYPAIDGDPVRPLKVCAGEMGARYELTGGALEISVSEENGMLAIRTVIEGLSGAHDISPVGCAKIEGAERVFFQGFGMGGPSGFKKPDEEIASHGVIAFLGADECLAVNAADHTRLHNLYSMKNGRFFAGFETECVPLGENGLPALYLRRGKNASDTVTACARDIAARMNARPVTKPAFHWCSWYYLYHTLDQPTLEEYLEGFSAHKQDVPFTHIQIDAGYFRSCGDWLDVYERFPQGLKHAADTIKKAGYEPGIWIGPFMVGDESRLFREHPDWMLKQTDGSYVREWQWYNEPKVWGYRDCDYYVLDTSNPDAMAYLRHVFTTLREWGFSLFKTDFMLWGIRDSSKVIRHTPGKTSYEYYRDVLQMIRESIGDARWLGCIAPFLPSIGYTDMMRVAGDVGAFWEEDNFGPINMLTELTADQYFNNVYWQNDPDAVMLRDFHIFLKPNEIEGLALLEAMSGGAVYTSDPIHKIAADRLELLKFIRPDKPRKAEYPLWGEERDDVCVVQRLKNRTLIYLFNATGRDITENYDWKALAGDRMRYLRRYHGETAPVEAVPFVKIPARSGVLFFATETPLEKDPSNIWEE